MNLTQKLRNLVDEIKELSTEVAQAKETLEEDEAKEIQELSSHLFSVQSFIEYYYLPVLRNIFGEEDGKPPKQKLYKKNVRFIAIYGGWQGFRDEIQNLTDWMPEEKADEKEKELKELYKDSWAEIKRKIVFIPVEDV